MPSSAHAKINLSPLSVAEKVTVDPEQVAYLNSSVLPTDVEFLLSVNDCLGLNCAYVTNIDKRGVITFEDDEGIYRFQVGYAPYIVEQKITEDTEEIGEDILASDDTAEGEN